MGIEFVDLFGDISLRGSNCKLKTSFRQQYNNCQTQEIMHVAVYSLDAASKNTHKNCHIQIGFRRTVYITSTLLCNF